MRCKIVYSNHSSSIHLEDMMLLIRLLLEAAGHAVDYDKALYSPNCCNLMIENFGSGTVNLVRDLKKNGGDLIIVATEAITNGTFNDFGGPDTNTHYSNKSYWQDRYQYFLECAKYARAVWCASTDSQQIQVYREALGGVPVLPLPYPHFPEFPRVVHRDKKDIDFFFSGTITAYRKQVLSVIGKKHHLFSSSAHLPDFLRRHFVGRSKICLTLRLHQGSRFPSHMRHWYHLNNGCCLIGEPYPNRFDLDSYLVTVPAENPVEYCGKVLDSDRWRAIAANAYERFVAEQPCKPVAQALLDRTFATR